MPEPSKDSKTPYPTPGQIPPQTQTHSPQPGLQTEMTPRPVDTALEVPGNKLEDYKGVGKLRNKVALVTGGDSGIGRAAAICFAKEGADVAIVYLPKEEKDAQEVKKLVEGEGRKCLLIVRIFQINWSIITMHFSLL